MILSLVLCIVGWCKNLFDDDSEEKIKVAYEIGEKITLLSELIPKGSKLLGFIGAPVIPNYDFIGRYDKTTNKLFDSSTTITTDIVLVIVYERHGKTIILCFDDYYAEWDDVIT